MRCWWTCADRSAVGNEVGKTVFDGAWEGLCMEGGFVWGEGLWRRKATKASAGVSTEYVIINEYY